MLFGRFRLGPGRLSQSQRAGGRGGRCSSWAGAGQEEGPGEGRGRTGQREDRARGRASPRQGRARGRARQGRHSHPTRAPSLPWEGQAVGGGCSPSLLAANGSRDRAPLSRVRTLTSTLIRSLSSILRAPHRCPPPFRGNPVSGRAGRGSSGLCPRHEQLIKFS